jgi:hypothetical protein
MTGEAIPAPREAARTAHGSGPYRRLARLAYCWGLFGVVALFAYAVLRLGTRGIATVAAGLAGWEWLVLALLTVAFVYIEGVRALQRRWVPWVAGRLQSLRTERCAWYLALAPLYAMALIGAPPRLLAAAWAGAAAIAVAVAAVSRFPDPWRGMVDVAVASALFWATLVLIATGASGLRRPPGRALRSRAGVRPRGSGGNDVDAVPSMGSSVPTLVREAE